MARRMGPEGAPATRSNAGAAGSRAAAWYGSIPVGAESYAKVASGVLATGIRR